jgi:two-component system cell cycle sensor histidine kinase/response regulator CckA
MMVERALTRFASDLSPAKGQQFFELLVAYITDCLGFEMAVVGELPNGEGPFTLLAEYPVGQDSSDRARSMMGRHCTGAMDRELPPPGTLSADGCVDIPLWGSDGRPIGLICGFGNSGLVDPGTTRMLFRILAHRAAAELERQRAQRELARRDALYVGLIAEAHDVVGVIDGHGAFTAVSPAIERVLGHGTADCVGLEVVDLVHPLDRPSVEALLRISGSGGYSVEARLQRKDGAWLTMEVTVAEHEADGRRFKVLSARDLTDRRRLEDRLRQSQKTEIIGRLASGIAHDFGNILMVVGSHADVMRLRTDADDPRHSHVDAIQAAVTRGADLARQLLAFSRHREFEPTRMDLSASIEKLAALLRRLVGSTIKLETDLSADARFIAADATQFEQIVLNLTLNARDAMPQGGTITFTTAPAANGPMPPAVEAAPGDFVCFSVTDTGCGIRDEVKPHIFEPLFTTKQEGAGTGIGLATVHEIVTRHGGHITVESVAGLGTTFRVYLPRHTAPTRRTAAAASHGA